MTAVADTCRISMRYVNVVYLLGRAKTERFSGSVDRRKLERYVLANRHGDVCHGGAYLPSDNDDNSAQGADKSVAALEQVLSHVCHAMHINRKSMHSLFYFMDKDGDGFLSCSDITKGLQRLGAACPSGTFTLKSADLEALMEYLDTDGDGLVDNQEFRAAFLAETAEGGPASGLGGDRQGGAGACKPSQRSRGLLAWPAKTELWDWGEGAGM